MHLDSISCTELQEERNSNRIESERVRGNDIRFGAAIILVHVSTQMVLTATKQVRMQGRST